MRRWELRRCSNPLCLHEHVREHKHSRSKHAELPCTLCGTSMLTLPLCVDVSALQRRNGHRTVNDPRHALVALIAAEQRLSDGLESDRVERVWHAARTLAFAQALELLGAEEGSA